MKKVLVIFALGAVLAAIPPKAQADKSDVRTIQRAQGEELSTAIGHYARARSLLVAAIREFDRGLKIADPSALINTEEWRKDLLDRTRDLEKVLDPQPRATNSGVSYTPDSRLLSEAK